MDIEGGEFEQAFRSGDHHRILGVVRGECEQFHRRTLLALPHGVEKHSIFRRHLLDAGLPKMSFGFAVDATGLMASITHSSIMPVFL